MLPDETICGERKRFAQWSNCSSVRLVSFPLSGSNPEMRNVPAIISTIH